MDHERPPIHSQLNLTTDKLLLAWQGAAKQIHLRTHQLVQALAEMGSKSPDAKKESLQERKMRLEAFLAIADRSEAIQGEIKSCKSLHEIIQISRRIEAAVDRHDFLFFWREIKKNYLPWHGLPAQRRREFFYSGEP